ncbi:MAG: Gfo/Idh/MocA family oxidoreductase, partial [bacterium]|nr:Gfo/Idh/MocA family oxidoreductase [bacterium]
RAGYPVSLVTIADHSLGSLDEADTSEGNLDTGEGALDLSGVRLARAAQDLIDDPVIDLISVCTHTDTHVELAIRAIEAGKHVLVEKPIAIDPREVQRLADVARKSDRVCMPAMCMRYWPAWVRVHDMIAQEQFGRVRSAEFHRLGSRPTWAADFYADEARSGGALYDLHIHDTDFIVHCFGMPSAVTTSGDGLHLSSIYHYDDGPVHVMAHGAWDHQPSVGFRMRCTIVCERATLDFDISREHQLVVHEGDGSTPVDVGELSGYDGEVRAIIDQITGRDENATSMDDAARVASLLECERRSMRTGTTESLGA